jgi:TIR domain
VNTQSHSSKAIFLSYASQDAEAARRVANALERAGIEVWFDQSELRGGEVKKMLVYESGHLVPQTEFIKETRLV